MNRVPLRIALSITALALIGAGWPELDQLKDSYKRLKEEARYIRDAIRKLRGKAPAPPPPTPPAAAPAASQAPGAVPAAGLTFQGNCVEKDETGYAENARLSIALGEVRTLDARIDIPKHGSCRFQLKDFQQTKTTPYVELLARSNSGCALRVWEQTDRVTMAATDCKERCTRGGFEYLWPVEFRDPGGACY